MYFSYYDSYSIGSHIFGVKMKDWFTPDYSTLTKLTVPGYRTIKAAEELDDSQKVREGGVNEGPFMVYRDGTYYLTLSIFGYTDSNYRVIQATSDSPLGTFTKIEESKGGKVISTDVANWSHLVSAGHHCFIRCGEELFIAYHTFKNRQDISRGRALGIDKVVWVKNSDGADLMHTNGPTYSVQALPESLSGYKNIATSASITSNNTASDSDVKLLNDSLIKYQEFDIVEEYEANQGKTEINISWDTFKTVRALMVFNSYDYEKTFVQITVTPAKSTLCFFTVKARLERTEI
jgi:beta-xylosidase